MATSQLHLTRAQLAAFLGDNHQQIRQFEKLFQTVNETSDAVTVDITDRIGLLENPPGIFIVSDHTCDTDAYWIVATNTGLTVTLPKAAAVILGRVWSVTLAAVGLVTIVTNAGDSVPTPANPSETTVILNRRGSTLSFRCTSSSTWSFA